MTIDTTAPTTPLIPLIAMDELPEGAAAVSARPGTTWPCSRSAMPSTRSMTAARMPAPR